MVPMESRQAGVGGEPVFPTRLDHVRDQPARQTVPGEEVGEPVTVEKRDSFNRAKPEVPLGIPMDLGDPIPNQAILGAKEAKRGLLRTQRVRGGDREDKKESKTLSHLAAAQADADLRILQSRHRTLISQERTKLTRMFGLSWGRVITGVKGSISIYLISLGTQDEIVTRRDMNAARRTELLLIRVGLIPVVEE
jgi:hypothetical protein